ncbi:MAG: hypothetical protein IBX64_08810 [Actinobacteria bacterium]|nr:hypothetical protein [Actinomycetota bacterium]
MAIKKWIAMGALYGLFSLIVFGVYERFTMGVLGGELTLYLVNLTPYGWSIALTRLVFPGSYLYPGFPGVFIFVTSIFLGAATGALLYGFYLLAGRLNWRMRALLLWVGGGAIYGFFSDFIFRMFPLTREYFRLNVPPEVTELLEMLTPFGWTKALAPWIYGTWLYSPTVFGAIVGGLVYGAYLLIHAVIVKSNNKVAKG